MAQLATSMCRLRGAYTDVQESNSGLLCVQTHAMAKILAAKVLNTRKIK